MNENDILEAAENLRSFAGSWYSEAGVVDISKTLVSIADQIEHAELRREHEGGKNGTLCPLLNRPCTENCAWADVQYEISEDGVANETFCAVAVIAAKLIMEDEDEQ